jgi:ligand-binding SRPBCC domain-containing protein
MPQFSSSVELPWPLVDVFEFFANPVNVVALSLPEMHLQFLEGPARLHLGARLVWKGRRWGFSRRVLTEVTAFEENVRLVEEQREGPFALWVHRHYFERVGAGTRIEDQIDFEPPTGILGRLLTAEFIVRDLHAAIAYRDQKLAELLAQ